MKNGAMFRKDCASAYNKSKLGHKRKLKETDKRDKNGQNENSDKIKLKLTRNSLNLSNFTSMSFSVRKMMVKQSFSNLKHFMFTRKSNRFQKKQSKVSLQVSSSIVQ